MRRIKVIVMLLLGVVWALSCTRDDDAFAPSHTSGGSAPRSGQPRGGQPKTWRVMLMVSGGYNDLSVALTEDLEEMAENYLPQGTAASSNVMAVLSRLPVNRLSTTSVPVLYGMYRLGENTIVRDTLRIWTADDKLFGGTVLKDALALVKEHYPAGSYGMVVSSHGSGWVPPLYYFNPSSFGDKLDDDGSTILWEVGKKSLGQDVDGTVMTELSLPDLVDAIGDNGLDYLLVDCCLCGCVEIAWALRGKVNQVGFSQTEILSDGFVYTSLVRRLLGGAQPDLQGVCQDYFESYDSRTGSSRSATISLVDTRRMQPLADVCSTLSARYRVQILALDKRTVQRYYRYNRHFYYDLKDVFLKAGITAEEEAQLDAALSQCVLYKAATPSFMKGSGYGFDITCHSGFSMFLPATGTVYLNNYYKQHIDWNNVTHFIE